MKKILFIVGTVLVLAGVGCYIAYDVVPAASTEVAVDSVAVDSAFVADSVEVAVDSVSVDSVAE